MVFSSANKQKPISLDVEPEHRSEWSRAWRRFTDNRLAVFGLICVILLCLMAIFADVLIPHDPIEIVSGMRGAPPSAEHPLGWDHVGRDLLSRVVFGARVSLIVGLSATAISVVIGVLVGVTAGYFGSWVDAVLSRLIDTLMSFPIIALLIVLSAVLGPSIITTVIVIGATTWARYARVVRGDVLSLKKRDFIMSARALGAPEWRIIWRHIIPNLLGPVIVLASLGVGGIIILEAALSFLGLGVRPPNPSWGGILADGRAFITLYPHISIAPGIMIVLTVLIFSFVGDGLRDALDPRQ